MDAFRQYIAAGAIVPNNSSAAAMAVSEGGIRNGDPSPYGVPWIDGLPGGMTSDQWNANTARVAQISQQRIAEAEMSGYFNNPDGTQMPTLQRQQIEAQIKSQVMQDETSRMLADFEVIRRTRELDRLELERQDAVRAGDLNRAQELQIEIDRQKFKREELAQAAGIAVGEVGGRSTLEAQQQAFNQQQTQAELASNPRTALQGWIAGQRGGIAGQPVGNQVTPTTTINAAGGVTGTTQNVQPGAEGMNYAGGWGGPGTPYFNESTGQYEEPHPPRQHKTSPTGRRNSPQAHLALEACSPRRGPSGRPSPGPTPRRGCPPPSRCPPAPSRSC